MRLVLPTLLLVLFVALGDSLNFKNVSGKVKAGTWKVLTKAFAGFKAFNRKIKDFQRIIPPPEPTHPTIRIRYIPTPNLQRHQVNLTSVNVTSPDDDEGLKNVSGKNVSGKVKAGTWKVLTKAFAGFKAFNNTHEHDE